LSEPADVHPIEVSPQRAKPAPMAYEDTLSDSETSHIQVLVVAGNENAPASFKIRPAQVECARPSTRNGLDMRIS